jgi:predicted transcriptional regulator
MSTTTIRLTEELKARVEAAAEKAGRSPHAFILSLIERGTEQAEQRASFVAEALAAREEFAQNGLGYDAEELHRYFAERAEGKKVRRPRPKKWRA